MPDLRADAAGPLKNKLLVGARSPGLKNSRGGNAPDSSEPVKRQTFGCFVGGAWAAGNKPRGDQALQLLGFSQQPWSPPQHRPTQSLHEVHGRPGLQNRPRATAPKPPPSPQPQTRFWGGWGLVGGVGEGGGGRGKGPGCWQEAEKQPLKKLGAAVWAAGNECGVRGES